MRHKLEIPKERIHLEQISRDMSVLPLDLQVKVQPLYKFV